MSKHLQEHYGKSPPPAQLSVIMDLCDHQLDILDSEKSTCLVCGGSFSLPALQEHLAAHMEEIALFILPNTDEEEETGASKASVQVAKLNSQGKNSVAESEVSSLGFSVAGSYGQSPADFTKLLTNEEAGYPSKVSSWRKADEAVEMSSAHSSKLVPEDFTVGWICATSTEYTAALAFFDERYAEHPDLPNNDNNSYAFGKIGKHNVVVPFPPVGEYGMVSASRVAQSIVYSFPNLRIALMVGIAGGAPRRSHDIRLGDVVVSAPPGGGSGVYFYDYGKTIQGKEYEPTGVLDQPPPPFLLATSKVVAQHDLHGSQIEESITEALEKRPRLRMKYQRPDPASDRLYRPDYIHQDTAKSCELACGNNPLQLVPRPRRYNAKNTVWIHYGLVASADRLMKDARMRDRFAERTDVLCFEMEASGLMNHFPCLVIRGISDYADSHKNDEWQGYAAMTAAAYTKDLLYQIEPEQIQQERPLAPSAIDLLQMQEESHSTVNSGDNSNYWQLPDIGLDLNQT